MNVGSLLHWVLGFILISGFQRVWKAYQWEKMYTKEMFNGISQGILKIVKNSLIVPSFVFHY